MILDEQDPAVARSGFPSTIRRFATGDHLRTVGGRQRAERRNLENESRSLVSSFAERADPPAMRLDEAFDDGETQSETAALALFLALLLLREGREDLLEVIALDAASGITDDDAKIAVHVRRGDRHAAATRR